MIEDSFHIRWPGKSFSGTSFEERFTKQRHRPFRYLSRPRKKRKYKGSDADMSLSCVAGRDKVKKSSQS